MYIWGQQIDNSIKIDSTSCNYRFLKLKRFLSISIEKYRLCILSSRVRHHVCVRSTRFKVWLNWLHSRHKCSFLQEQYSSVFLQWCILFTGLIPQILSSFGVHVIFNNLLILVEEFSSETVRYRFPNCDILARVFCAISRFHCSHVIKTVIFRLISDRLFHFEMRTIFSTVSF